MGYSRHKHPAVSLANRHDRHIDIVLRKESRNIIELGAEFFFSFFAASHCKEASKRLFLLVVVVLLGSFFCCYSGTKSYLFRILIFKL